MGFWQDLLGAGAGFLSGGPVGAAIGFGSAASQKSGGNAQTKAATGLYDQQAQQAQQGMQTMQAILPALFKNAGYDYTPGVPGAAGAHGQPGTPGTPASLSQQPFGDVYNTDRYKAFQNYTLRPLEAEREGELAKFGSNAGKGTFQGGFGPAMINREMAQQIGQANDQYGLAQQARQDQFLGEATGAAGGMMGQGPGAASGLTQLGQYGQNRSDTINNANYSAAGMALGQHLYDQSLKRVSGSGNLLNDPNNYGPPSSGVLDYPPDPGSGGYGSVSNPYGPPSVYGKGG